MKVLVVGNGSREHALGWALAQDDRVNPAEELFFAPGNAGTGALGSNLPLKVTDLEGIRQWSLDHKVELVVIGPEAPLVAGLTDVLEAEGIRVFGPNKEASQLEGSKIFTKELLVEAGIPTGASERFSDASAAKEYVRTQECPIVVKADGLAAGKGVIICQNTGEAEDAITQIMEDRAFGEAGAEVLIEEFLDGPEASIHAITDGKDYVLFPTSQDHKRALDGDQGLNTGGMGAYAPAPVVTPELFEQIEREVFKPIVAALNKRRITYKGVLYGGLMLTSKGPKVLEFNSRFGDPETQVLLPLLETPLLDVINATIDGNIGSVDINISSRSAMTVVLASEGYPESPNTGDAIHGLDAEFPADSYLFQAGTKQEGDQVVTSGGRVLSLTGVGETLQEARDRAYALTDVIGFRANHYRNDIGYRAL